MNFYKNDFVIKSFLFNKNETLIEKNLDKNEILSLIEDLTTDNFEIFENSINLLILSLKNEKKKFFLILNLQYIIYFINNLFINNNKFNFVLISLKFLENLFIEIKSISFDLPNDFISNLIHFLEEIEQFEIITQSIKCLTILFQNNIYLYDLNSKIVEKLINLENKFSTFDKNHKFYFISQYIEPFLLYSLTSLFFINNKSFDYEKIDYLHERLWYWFFFTDKEELLENVLYGFLLYFDLNYQNLFDLMKKNDSIERLFYLITLNNSNIIVHSLNIIYSFSQYDPFFFPIDKIIKSIQFYLRRRGNTSEFIQTIISLKILSIFSSITDFHEIFVQNGLVTMICSLLMDQKFEVKFESAISLCTFLLSVTTNQFIQILNQYNIITPLLDLLETDKFDVIIGILQLFCRVLRINQINRQLSIHCQNIVESIKVESLLNSSQSIISDLITEYQRLL